MPGQRLTQGEERPLFSYDLDGIEKGQLEILADDISVQLKAGLSQDLGEYQAKSA